MSGIKNAGLPFLIDVVEFLVEIHALRLCEIKLFWVGVHNGFNMIKKLWWIFFINYVEIIDNLDFTKKHVYFSGTEIIVTRFLNFMKF